MKYHKQFLIEIKIINPYLIKFKENSFIKSKIYLEDCVIRDLNWQSIIFIIDSKSTSNIDNN